MLTDLLDTVRGAVISKVEEHYKVSLPDLAVQYPKDPKYFLDGDDIHFKDKGNAILADLFVKAILKKKLIDGE